MSSELDGLFVKATKPPSGEVAKPLKKEGSRYLRYRKKHVQDWSEHDLKTRLVGLIDTHQPLHTWKFQRTKDVVRQLFGEADYHTGFLHRAGRALAQIAREYPPVVRQFRHGRARYLLPPLSE